MPEDIIIPDILPPSEDGIFKSILTREESKPVLRDVISSILEVPVVEAVVRNAEPPITDINEKREVFDVNCKLDGDKQAAVEMQSRNMQGDNMETEHPNIRGRSVLELCKLHASQPGRGSHYADLLKSYQITFCNYTVFPELGCFVNRFGFYNKEGYELSDSVGIIFVELTKLDKIMKKPVENMTPAEMWAIFFKYGDSAKHKVLLDKIRDQRGEIEVATNVLTSISKDEVERAHYRSRQIFQMDMASNYAASRQQGAQQGHREEQDRVIALIRAGYSLEQLEAILLAERENQQ
ncbi:MAG: Rpn family recombination-promoting nuclease/putative transposase [Oscillospiraceae bacterium]|jgi:predicted transposase/invertase (TIGR01784 family)|nr:Rpn family recombination-promoting nuclease/putative transposase [Oscillospiraceae bacterium]